MSYSEWLVILVALMNTPPGKDLYEKVKSLFSRKKKPPKKSGKKPRRPS